MSDADKWSLLTLKACETRRMATARTQDVIISDTMGELARKTILYKRGKRVSESFYITTHGLAVLAAS